MKKEKDSIGNRMKEYYESVSQTRLLRRTYAIIRLDGKAFHTYTFKLEKPFDSKFHEDMSETGKFLCESIQGAEFAYTQSDEISLLLTDFKNLDTDAWFGGNIQKMTSVSASLATAKFNELRPGNLAFFDSRVFNIPAPIEVENYFIWRQQDAVRNSISSAARAVYSHLELQNKNTDEMQEMLFEKGINWNDYDAKFKRGSIVKKDYVFKDGVERTYWKYGAAPDFLKERLIFRAGLIPTI